MKKSPTSPSPWRAGDYLDMLECVMNEVKVTLSEKERQAYDTMRSELVLSLGGEEVDAGNAAALANKLSQMANGAVYGEDKKILPLHNRKLDALEDLIEAANGKPVLVAYWFKHDLERIRTRFTVREIKTAQDIADWNLGKSLWRSSTTSSPRTPSMSGLCPPFAEKTKHNPLLLTRSRPIWRCNMTAKEYLSQARLLDARINAKIQQVSALNDLATHATATLTGMPHNPSRSESRMAEAVIKIIDLQNEINHDIDELVDLKREITRRVKSIPNTEYQLLLEKRYLCFMPWEKIAVDMGYSIQHIYRLHDWALREFPVPKET